MNLTTLVRELNATFLLSVVYVCVYVYIYML